MRSWYNKSIVCCTPDLEVLESIPSVYSHEYTHFTPCCKSPTAKGKGGADYSQPFTSVHQVKLSTFNQWRYHSQSGRRMVYQIERLWYGVRVLWNPGRLSYLKSIDGNACTPFKFLVLVWQVQSIKLLGTYRSTKYAEQPPCTVLPLSISCLKSVKLRNSDERRAMHLRWHPPQQPPLPLSYLVLRLSLL